LNRLETIKALLDEKKAENIDVIDLTSKDYIDDIKDESFENLNQDGLNLIYESLLLGSVLNEAFAKREMQKITEYLTSLAASVHKFYNDHKVVGSAEQNMYLKALSMSALSIRVGLDLLGIKAKDKM